jgi:hypothetical protein
MDSTGVKPTNPEKFAVQVSFVKNKDAPKYVYSSSFSVSIGDLVVVPGNNSHKLPSVAIVTNILPWDKYQSKPQIKYSNLIQVVTMPNDATPEPANE